MKLPHPNETLSGCVWLPRHIAKIRAYLSRDLPLSYRIAFGSKIGVDGYFFRHFNLSLEQMIAAVKRLGNDEAIANWFASRPEGSADSIARWNAYAQVLGAPGRPGSVTLSFVKWFFYPRAIFHPVRSIFEAIVQDEGLAPPNCSASTD